MEDEMIQQEEHKGFLTWLKEVFTKKKEEAEAEDPKYKRRLFDGRIEKYLDQNLDAYISEYGIVTGLDLEVYEERHKRLTWKISEMSEYMIDKDAEISVLERDLDAVQKAAKKKR